MWFRISNLFYHDRPTMGSGLYAFLIGTIPQPAQGVFIEANPWNATAGGLFHNRTCAWPETLGLAQFAHLLNVGL